MKEVGKEADRGGIVSFMKLFPVFASEVTVILSSNTAASPSHRPHGAGSRRLPTRCTKKNLESI